MSDNNFKVLSDEEHLKIRPSMYIGSVDETELHSYFINLSGESLNPAEYKTIKIVPGLAKIINEIIDNSVDENIRTNGKFANKIDVTMSTNLEGFTVSVKDNGRGIPIVKPDGIDEYRPVLSWSRARSGTSFDASRVTLGANGVGSFATYVFSTKFFGETHDGTNGLTFQKDGMITKVVKSKKNFTNVTFMPDLNQFNKGEVDFESHAAYIRQRLINLSVCYPKIKFTFNNELVSIHDTTLLANSFYKDNIIVKESDFTIIIGSTAEFQEFRFHSYINGLHNPNGGAVIDFITSELCNVLQPLIKKKHKIEVTPSQIKNNLFLGLYLSNFENLKFDSQTKEKITNSKAEVASYFGKYDFLPLAKKLLADENIITPIIQSILAKKELAERLELARKQKKSTKLDIVNHIQATHPIPEERLLFIAEGLSAMSPLISTRKTNKIGGYPLRGKILNVAGMKYNAIMDNTTISELLSVIGLQLGKVPVDLNYGRICIMTDADVDGISIRMQLFNLFYLWGSKLFDENRIFIVKTPLLSARKGDDLRLYYSFDEYHKDQKNIKGYEETYFKGLGTMPLEVYEECINNPKLVPVSLSSDSDKRHLEMAFGDDADLRKKWLLGDFK